MPTRPATTATTSNHRCRIKPAPPHTAATIVDHPPSVVACVAQRNQERRQTPRPRLRRWAVRVGRSGSYPHHMPDVRVYGGWSIGNKIGGGGNGDVYRCTGTNGIDAAIKVLRRARHPPRDRIVRFRNEVHFLISQGRRPGVMWLLDYALPDDPAKPCWYVMPLAVPLLQALGASPEFPHIVEAVGHIARTLADLADEVYRTETSNRRTFSSSMASG